MSERSERVGRRRERRRLGACGSRSTRATTATTPQDPPRAVAPERSTVNHPGQGGAAHGRVRQRRRRRRRTSPTASHVGGRTLTSSYTGQLRCGSVGAGGSYGGVVVARSAATPTASAASAARRSVGHGAHCARSRAVPPPDKHRLRSTVLLCCSGSRSPAAVAPLLVTSPYAPSSLRGRARSRFHNWIR